jgi:3-methylcrotonyl-CoA carboxylase alpha subunit
MFASLLIANRGEIACRIMRTTRCMGIRTIAVYSDADARALHVREADEAHHIGPAEARLSYLDGEKILRVAKATGAAAIHPGYGFLSENAEFAEACESQGIAFVGPTPEAIRRMGLKDEAKTIAREAGVPVVPGYQGMDAAPEQLRKEAATIGYPVIIKAVAGGGGRGMRVVEGEEAFARALEACQREAKAAFGDARVLLEKYFARTRHVEVQVMGDAYGNVIHLFERDCSIQRRHQKIIEEAPAFAIPPDIRTAMLAAAVTIARTVNYRNAGTIEFLYEPDSGRFYFMEMNTRLQVEHPATEMITGIDLVELQLKVAAGMKLPVKQERVEANGHAIEARLYAEDPAQGFLPQTGIVRELRWPSLPNCRIDTGIEEGSEIGSSYDSMVAKLIVWAQNRGDAIKKLRAALRETALFGIRTNKGFLLSLAADRRFSETAPTTRFLDELGSKPADAPADLIPLSCAAWLFADSGAMRDSGPWSARTGWQLGGTSRRAIRRLLVQGRIVEVEFTCKDELAILEVEGKRHALHSVSLGAGRLTINMDGVATDVFVHRSGRELFVDVEGHHVGLTEPEFSMSSTGGPAEGALRAPMPGRVLKVEVKQGQTVSAGERLMVLEAMKMEHIMRAPIAGRIADLSVAEGAQVREGDILCVLKPEAA